MAGPTDCISRGKEFADGKLSFVEGPKGCIIAEG